MTVNHDHVEVVVVAIANAALGVTDGEALRWVLPVADFGVGGVNAVDSLGRCLVLMEDMHVGTGRLSGGAADEIVPAVAGLERRVIVDGTCGLGTVGVVANRCGMRWADNHLVVADIDGGDGILPPVERGRTTGNSVVEEPAVPVLVVLGVHGKAQAQLLEVAGAGDGARFFACL